MNNVGRCSASSGFAPVLAFSGKLIDNHPNKPSASTKFYKEQKQGSTQFAYSSSLYGQ